MANEDFFRRDRKNLAVSRRVQFNAQDLGAETEMDGQGRVLFSPELRRELGIEGQNVRIVAHAGGRLDIFSSASYEENLRDAKTITPEDVDLVQGDGML